LPGASSSNKYWNLGARIELIGWITWGVTAVLSSSSLSSATPIAARVASIALRPGNLPTDRNSGSDHALLQRIAEGDQLAMRALFARHRDQAFRFILRLTKDEALAEDILIDSFFEVWQCASRFEGRSTFSTWLLAIARNKAISALGRRSTVQLEDRWASTIPDPADDPELALQGKDLGEALRRCLAGLSPKHTEVIDLVYYHEKSVAEVAAILQLPEATVKTRMFYARRRLAQLVHAATHA
jgi:RNA polymerase sigma-70 factor (ECF subfamily)